MQLRLESERYHLKKIRSRLTAFLKGARNRAYTSSHRSTISYIQNRSTSSLRIFARSATSHGKPCGASINIIYIHYCLRSSIIFNKIS